ncbi:MAG: AraC family transcriptional regulator, partial [Clostridiales bacterium]|nr:AraC family transcriptional regulator [Clostridiales bacterium]
MNKKAESSSYFSDTYFPEGSPLINVLNASHHGKGGLHGHSFYELVFVEQGYTLHVCEGVTSILTSGDIFIIVPNQNHNYINANHAKIYNCLISPEVMESLKADLIELPGIGRLYQSDPEPPFERLHCDMASKAEIISLLEKLKTEYKTMGEGYELKMKSMLAEIMVIYARLHATAERAAGENTSNMGQIMTAIEFIESNCTRDVLLDEIAEASGLSSSHLTRQFKLSIGLTPIEYSRSFRMAKAAELLRDMSLKVSDVSKAMGFTDISLFSRQFRQITGMS